MSGARVNFKQPVKCTAAPHHPSRGPLQLTPEALELQRSWGVPPRTYGDKTRPSYITKREKHALHLARMLSKQTVAQRYDAPSSASPQK